MFATNLVPNSGGIAMSSSELWLLDIFLSFGFSFLLSFLSFFSSDDHHVLLAPQYGERSGLNIWKECKSV